MQRIRLFAVLFLIGCLFTNVTGPTSPAKADDCQNFSDTGFKVCGKFLTYWTSHGGLSQQGLPISDVFDEQNAAPPAGDGKVHKVQYFERARFEMHDENQAPYDVLLGLLGTEQFKAKYSQVAAPAVQPEPCQYFKETDLKVCGRFLEYWTKNGGLAQQGLPISGVIDETNAPPPAGDGKLHKVQYFERARFELHAENTAPYDVLLGLLGTEQYTAKYVTKPPQPTPTPQPMPIPTPTPGPAPSGGAQCLPTPQPTETDVQACVSNPTPARKSDVTVYARLIIKSQPVANTSMTSTWHYKSTSSGCDATAGSDGIAACTLSIGGATSGYTVKIDITMHGPNGDVKGSTSFTPQ